MRYILPLLALITLVSCEDFFEPLPQNVIKEEDFFTDDADFRTAEMGLYSIQQELVEQLVILGELRGDLLEVTENADAELLEIYNFNITANNKYASPVNFYKLIANCNILLNKIREKQPSVLDVSNKNLSNMDRMHGSVLAMRAWAYFNAVRIYGKVPYIPDFLSEIDDIISYINEGTVVVDEEMIRFGLTSGVSGGISLGDTVLDSTIVLERIWLDKYAIIDTFTVQLETMIKTEGSGVDSKPVIGVDYNIDGVGDSKWEITTWNQYAYYCLLGQMYLTYDDLLMAEKYFHKIVYFESSNVFERNRYLLAQNLNGNTWGNMFSKVNSNEFIYAVEFNRVNHQENDFREIFNIEEDYMLKPTKGAVFLWENDEWVGWQINNNGTSGKDKYNDDYVRRTGEPGDWFRGNLASYAYYKPGSGYLSDTEIKNLLELRRLGKDKEVFNFMADVDTVVYKYGRSADSDFSIYRAGSVHLYMAEIFHRLLLPGPIVKTHTHLAQPIINNGNYGFFDDCKGVRGRVGMGYENVPGTTDYFYVINPYTGELLTKEDNIVSPVTGVRLKSNEELNYAVFNGISQKRDAFEEYILEERAKECAFEGERFYDIMRIAERRNDPEFLANKVAAKYRGEQRTIIRNKLMNKSNWYVPFDIGVDEE